MSLALQPRFRRSIRIDSDYKSKSAIDDFFCPPSFASALTVMAQHVDETGQAAFTWTGPYGGGKSSLALALACLTGAPKSVRERAALKIGSEPVAALKDALPYYPSRWDVCPLVVERRSLSKQLFEAFSVGDIVPKTQSELFNVIETRIETRGLLLILDEFGRGLEAAAEGEGDLHILQDLAELASRSGGRFVFIGILHQSFEDYAGKLSSNVRGEWSKIQGRFADIAIATTLDETLALIGQAMPATRAPKGAAAMIEASLDVLRPRPIGARAEGFKQSLKTCLPLHPLSAILLGPISRRRFAQNQRSVFTFLSGSERFAFRDVMDIQQAPRLYPVDALWDYLGANFESPILASRDGRKWVVAADTIERCAARGGTTTELRILKIVGLLEMLKDRAALVPSFETLRLALNDLDAHELKRALERLMSSSELIYRKHSRSYVLYAGSDFDIDEAVETLKTGLKSQSLALLRKLADLQPVLAKRHHWQSGTQRWFAVDIMGSDELVSFDVAVAGRDRVGRIGLVVGDDQTSDADRTSLIIKASARDPNGLTFLGLAPSTHDMIDAAEDLKALSDLDTHYPELRSDRIAQREIENRIGELRRKIEDRVRQAFRDAQWSWGGCAPRTMSRADLNAALSQQLDLTFDQAPAIDNELLNCTNPSSNAVSARTKLMKRMVLRDGEPDLGFSGKTFPAERGLYESLLVKTGLYRQQESGEKWAFAVPSDSYESQLEGLWTAADQCLKNGKSEPVSGQRIIDLWSQAPYGLKPGLAPIFIVAYALSRRDTVAVYGEGVFQARMNALTVEFLARNPSDIGLRRVEMEGFTRQILDHLGQRMGLSAGASPLLVARGMVARFDELVPWLTRTQSLTPTALKVRDVLKRAHDPNKLLLDDLPQILAGGQPENAKVIAKMVWDALAEMRAAYPRTLAELKELMLTELDARGDDDMALERLRARAETILRVGGDLRVDGFIGRVAQFYGTEDDMEGLAGLAAGRLPRDWNDGDREKARVGLAELARAFLRLEALAHVKGRKDHRQALAVVVGREDAPVPLFRAFEVAETDQADVTLIVSAVDAALAEADANRRDIILAALVEVTSRYLQDIPETADLRERA